MSQTGPDDWRETQLLDQQTSDARLSGFYQSHLWVALPAIAAVPIIAVVGEGDYIILILGLLWAALLVGAVRVRKRSQEGTARRACATWVAVWSSLAVLLMAAMTIAALSDGSWR